MTRRRFAGDLQRVERRARVPRLVRRLGLPGSSRLRVRPLRAGGFAAEARGEIAYGSTAAAACAAWREANRPCGEWHRAPPEFPELPDGFEWLLLGVPR